MASTSPVARPESIVSASASDSAQRVLEFPPQASDDDFAKALETNYQSKKLRAACTQLGLNPRADPMMDHKNGYIKLLTQYRRALQRGEVFSGYPQKPTKRTISLRTRGGSSRTKQYGFRLINVVFSHGFIGRINESGIFLLLRGKELKKGMDGRSEYWKDVATAYTTENAEFNQITGSSGRYDGINPTLAQQYSSVKLCSIWKDITARYKASLARWKQLRTSDDVGFAEFCCDLDVVYLYEKLQMEMDQVDSEELRPSKRARTGDGVEERETDGADAVDSDAEERMMERGNLSEPSETGQTPSRCAAMRQFVPANNEGRSRLGTYDGVIYSSQAVRDTMSAIEALKRSSFDRTVIAQAEESMEALVQVWLRELTKVRQSRAR
uniref:Uncharacterized protein n=1 Tax=Hyaloperonospora arabidopsidis (strain Emoy2) TaxID=559515 RepID=M4C5M9_HYAAE